MAGRGSGSPPFKYPVARVLSPDGVRGVGLWGHTIRDQRTQRFAAVVVPAAMRAIVTQGNGGTGDGRRSMNFGGRTYAVP